MNSMYADLLYVVMCCMHGEERVVRVLVDLLLMDNAFLEFIHENTFRSLIRLSRTIGFKLT
jgi:hypothetical protein